METQKFAQKKYKKSHPLTFSHIFFTFYVINLLSKLFQWLYAKAYKSEFKNLRDFVATKKLWLTMNKPAIKRHFYDVCVLIRRKKIRKAKYFSRSSFVKLLNVNFSDNCAN